jgi:hypothetical protein
MLSRGGMAIQCWRSLVDQGREKLVQSHKLHVVGHDDPLFITDAASISLKIMSFCREMMNLLLSSVASDVKHYLTPLSRIGIFRS